MQWTDTSMVSLMRRAELKMMLLRRAAAECSLRMLRKAAAEYLWIMQSRAVVKNPLPAA